MKSLLIAGIMIWLVLLVLNPAQIQKSSRTAGKKVVKMISKTGRTVAAYRRAVGKR